MFNSNLTIHIQFGHSPGSQRKVRESDKGLKWSGKVREFEKKLGMSSKCQGISTACPNVKVTIL